MDTRKRDSILRHWREVIVREAHDLAALQQVRERALRDIDVRDHPTLPRLIRAKLENHRAALEQDQQTEPCSPDPPEPQSCWRAEVPVPVHTTTPEQDVVMFKRLAKTLGAALDHGDEKDSDTILAQMQVLHVNHRTRCARAIYCRA